MLGIGKLDLKHQPYVFKRKSGASLEYLFAENGSVAPYEGTAPITVTRSGATASRWKIDGTLDTAVAANEPRLDYDPSTLAYQNLLTYSQQEDNAAYAKTRTSVVSNAAIAPDGSLTADKLVEDSSNNTHFSQYTTYSYTSGLTYTASRYVRAGERSKCELWFPATIFPTNRNATFDLVAGTASHSGTGIASIESVGNGWYRCIFSLTCASSGSGYACSINLDNGSGISYTGDGTSGIYVWGAQLNTGSTALPYKQTVTTTLTEYAAKGLLVEEARTNLRTYSSQFDNAAWTKSGLTVSSDASTAPDGTVSMDKLVESALNEVHRIDGNNVSMTTGTAYTFSVFAKAAERSVLQLTVDGTALPATHANFDLSNGTVSATGSSVTASIQNVGNGIYRCIATVTATGTATANDGYWLIANSPTMARFAAYAGDGSSGLYVWGDQFEAGSFATSYIATTSAAVTRNADAAVVNDLTGWYNASEGTLYVDAIAPPVQSGLFPHLASLQATSSSASAIRLYLSSTNQGRAQVRVGGVASFDSAGAVQSPGARMSAALAYKENDANWGLNGITVTTDTTVSLPTVAELSIGYEKGSGIGNYFNGHIRHLAYFPRRVTNTELVAYTT